MHKQQIVALSIDKVQTFLTEAIHAHVQEKQTEEATLKSIMRSSEEISVGFRNTIEKAFEGVEKNKLLYCSGVYIFSCSLQTEDIERRLNQLFVDYYKNSHGQKLLRCVSFSLKNDGQINAVQEAKKRLKQSQYLNIILEEKKDVLFNFCAAKETNTWSAEETEANYPLFAKDINALFCKENSDNENRFRIAVIKADLDGMGDMFKGIDDYDSYRKISKILNENICLGGLYKSTEACSSDAQTGWLFPFYIAGDDIFFAVSVSNLICGIEVCREILKNINKKLKNALDSAKKLSMSIGVEITFNRQPIRYYMDMLEKQLKIAKKAQVPDLLCNFTSTKISIGGTAYLDIDYAEIKDRKKSYNKSKKILIDTCLKSAPIWDFLLRDLRTLKAIQDAMPEYNNPLATPHFLYTLLTRLTDESVQNDDMKYINSVLYHLLPKYLDSSDENLQQWELLLNTGIIRQLYVRPQSRQGVGQGVHIVLDKERKHRLETYLRLILLFSDSRFHITSAFAPGKAPALKQADWVDVRKYLLSKPAEYLHERVLNEKSSKLTKIFAKNVTYDNCQNGTVRYSCLQRLRIEKTMFFKLRDTRRISIEKAADMIALRNSDSKKTIGELNSNRISAGKAAPYLYFDKDLYLSQAKKSGAWTPDFVDSLMLLYEYNRMTIVFKSKFSSKLK